MTYDDMRKEPGRDSYAGRAPEPPPRLPEGRDGPPVGRVQGRDDVASALPPSRLHAESVTPSDAGTPRVSSQPRIEDVGSWVLETLREHQFNLLSAARTLQQARLQGATREQVPVFDRGALDYYLCGEFFRRMVEHAYAMDAVVADLAGNGSLVPRVRRKVRAYLRPLRARRKLDRKAAAELLRDGYRRVPERYHLDIEQAIEALRRRRWRLD